MTPKLRIALFSPDKNIADVMELRLRSKGHQVVTLTHLTDLLGFIYSDPPDLLIVDLTAPDPEIQTVIRNLKEEGHFSVIPIIGLIQESMEELFDWAAYPQDDFLLVPVRYPELFNRVDLSLQRIQRVFDHNPLTKLPGNTSIQKAIEKTLGKPMAVCYIDVNHFKPYNDTFGFARGDEVLRMLARIMSNAVKESGKEDSRARRRRRFCFHRSVRSGGGGLRNDHPQLQHHRLGFVRGAGESRRLLRRQGPKRGDATHSSLWGSPSPWCPP